jgi:hypothetical protein
MTASVSEPPADDVTVTVAGGMTSPTVTLWTGAKAVIARGAAPLLSTGGVVSSLEDASITRVCVAMEYSALVMNTRSITGLVFVAEVFAGKAGLLNGVALAVKLTGPRIEGGMVAWPKNLPSGSPPMAMRFAGTAESVKETVAVVGAMAKMSICVPAAEAL